MHGKRGVCKQVCVYGYVCSRHFDCANVCFNTRVEPVRAKPFLGPGVGCDVGRGFQDEAISGLCSFYFCFSCPGSNTQTANAMLVYDKRSKTKHISMTGLVTSQIRRRMGFPSLPK
ncbi:hypothetical protein CGRA01v4_01371 [Colletotrichum graminicola]|nr:hypothetical protein CGRA01v4_01371 [Colletotrichum graminicola]